MNKSTVRKMVGYAALTYVATQIIKHIMVINYLKDIDNKRQYPEGTKLGVCDAGIEIVYNPLSVAASGLLFAASATEKSGEIKIWVDDNYLKLDDTDKEAILQHEIAHVMKNHLSSNLCQHEYVKKRQKGDAEILRMEYEADEAAACVVGVDNMIHAITMISANEVCAKNKKTLKELNARIEHLTKMKLV